MTTAFIPVQMEQPIKYKISTENMLQANANKPLLGKPFFRTKQYDQQRHAVYNVLYIMLYTQAAILEQDPTELLV